MSSDQSATASKSSPSIAKPKVFISYSRSSEGHQERVRLWAERLIQDGVEVILDVYDLKEGQDKYAFMEKMVTDKDVTHVLVVSDKSYAEKADAKRAGVGTESQIISREVYEKVEQSKFIPLVCEFAETEPREPFLPTFLKSRIWIDFSSPEAVNEHWEQLVRVLYGKPAYQKPQIGTPPQYIFAETAIPSNPATGKFEIFRQALLQNKTGLKLYRKDFLTASLAYADSLRTRQPPSNDSIGTKILDDCGKLRIARNQIVDWVLLESAAQPSNDFIEALLDVLEQLRELKSRPPEINSWSDEWFEAHSVFVYETFLYIIAALLKTGSYDVLNEVFTSHYIRPKSERYGEENFQSFGCFYGQSDALQSVLAPEGRRLLSPAAELVKRQADRKDLPFSAIMEAELLTLMMAFIIPDADWYPQTLHYASQTGFPFFVRATQHKHFMKLATITGIKDADALRTAVKEGYERLGVQTWYDFRLASVSLWHAMNMDKLDTIK